MILECRFPATPKAVGNARRFVAKALEGVSNDMVETVSLMVSELASNAVVHPATEFNVRVVREDEYISVSVEDKGVGTPQLQEPSTNDLHGRGLQIVKALSSDWGITRTKAPGKTVWFKVAL